VQVQTPGWFGIGFNPSSASMVGSDAILSYGEPAEVGTFLLTTQSPGPNPPLGWSSVDEELTDVSTESVDNFGQLLKFRRPLSPGNLTAIDLGTDTFVVVAYGWLTPLSYHVDNRTTLQINFQSGGSTVGNPPFIEEAHGLLMSISWLVLIPLGIIFAKFFRTKDNDEWFQSHRIFQTTAYLLTLAAFVCGIVMVGHDQFACTHGDFGLATFIAATLQMLLGLFRPSPTATHRLKWNIVHHWFGRLVLFNAWATIILGLFQIGANVGFVIAAVVWMALVLLFYFHMLTRLHTSGTYAPVN